MEDALIEYAAYSAEVDEALKKLIQIKREISEVIDAVPDYRYQAILRGLYLEGKNFNDLSKELFYHPYTVRAHLRRKALGEVERILEEREK